MPAGKYSPFTDNPKLSIASLGELRLIENIRRWLGSSTPPSPHGIGDDCALLNPSKHPQLLTVDPVVYNEHFNDSISPAHAGQKLLNRNLSDIAAMGGRPRAAVISLALDARTKTSWLAAFYRSIARIAQQHQLPIVGGDITRLANGIVATLTLVGETTARPLTRHASKPGDYIYVTGTLGGSILGKHCRFTPRLAEGQWLAQNRHVHALMDISDGLAKDLHSLTPAGTSPLLFPNKIPISPAAKKLSKSTNKAPLHHALCDGEDYELLFTLSANADTSTFESQWRKKFPKLKLTRIGTFTQHPGKLTGALILTPDTFAGYEHFHSTP